MSKKGVLRRHWRLVLVIIVAFLSFLGGYQAGINSGHAGDLRRQLRDMESKLRVTRESLQEQREAHRKTLDDLQKVSGALQAAVERINSLGTPEDPGGE